MSHQIKLQSFDYRNTLTLMRDKGCHGRMPLIRIDCNDWPIWLDMKGVQKMIDWLQIQVMIEDVR